MSLSVVATLAALPWLQGFFAPVASSDQTSHDVIAELSEWRLPDEDCTGTAYGGMELRADISPSSEGTERVLASYTQGLVVLGEGQHLLAQAPGFDCEGSADELVAIAAGDVGIGIPILALAASAGGRTESVTWLTLYRVSNAGELQPVFMGEVERHVGRTTRTGTVTVIPGGLVYIDPIGMTSLWTYDAERGRYIEQLAARPAA